ncbi:hypothetical protein P167DRAFT_570890 [Morchella conica CCBAS932]|uniref:DUF7580 domain-containing protein n=1 Tax=Morchella conica CCBAS932 TaxID=1392247 RepID=A0A3N4L3U4_9PEZI|nr:hypothetical protein P167DRAFT_570890 [Morchella conica CCBAS932]
MVTGIETAGLALAIFPLVIEGLKSYSNGARTIKDMWRSQVTLKSLIRELRMEKCKFENTLTSLLEGVASDQPNLLFLMNDPECKFWCTKDFQETLKSRLRPDMVEVYIEAMEELYSALESLTNKFALGSECEPDDKTALKRKWKMIRLVLSKAEYKEQLNQISKINTDLQTLTGQTNVSDTTFSNTTIAQATTSVKNYKRIRDHAMSLHRVLKENLQPVAPFCQCSTLHNANLQLEMRNATLRQKGFGHSTSIRFHVVISFERAAGTGIPLLRSWRDLELEPVDNDREDRESLASEQAGKIDSSSSGGTRGAGFHSHAIPPSPSVAAEGNKKHRKSRFIWNTKSGAGVNPPPQEDEMLSKTSSLPEPHNTIQRTRASTKASLKSSFLKHFSLPEPRNPIQHTHATTKAPPKSSLQIPRSESRPTTPRKVSFAVSSTPPISVVSRTPSNQIKHLCSIIQQAESDQSCLGVLADKSGQYLVWPLMSSSPPESTDLISLHNLLDEGKMPAKRDTLILGVQLASTVLQLHKTGWLAEDWSSRDIFFHQINTEGLGGVPDFKKPFVRQSPDLDPSLQQTQSKEETTKSALIPHDRSLFSLGIVLIEIWHGFLLEKLQIRTDGDESGFNTNYMTARRLIGEISSNAGAKYGDAVRRCIQGLDHRSGSLDVDDFKSEVHMKVVAPLIDNLKHFCDEDISQIFPEKRNMSASI